MRFRLHLAFVNKEEANHPRLLDTVRTLKSQVNALLERRQEDFNILEESIRRSLDKNSELATLRKDLNDLR
ncbi:hypothetical protein Phum_PHUM500990 [Pediculus humanus corporis]|uniref:Uncharacterized protein n=1 Tax=Pediculus humanus subsp. corporis TaxID=121224 RepID=E0VXI7_PEDHC|nr:uncharacterized protein Phum_PHUM500990 [Pediculus humanus corporis]EEB18093.1 hypothetical protein Phum_PHUM500990 [Pediculus humanus corporis]